MVHHNIRNYTICSGWMDGWMGGGDIERERERERNM